MSSSTPPQDYYPHTSPEQFVRLDEYTREELLETAKLLAGTLPHVANQTMTLTRLASLLAVIAHNVNFAISSPDEEKTRVLLKDVMAKIMDEMKHLEFSAEEARSIRHLIEKARAIANAG